MGQQGGRSWQEQPFPLQEFQPNGGIEAVASAQGEQPLTAQVGMEQRLVAGRRQEHLWAGQGGRLRAGGGGHLCLEARNNEVMGGHKEGQGRGGQGNGHHLRIAEGGVQGVCGREGWRLWWLTGPHQSGQGEQHSLQVAGLDLLHSVVGAPEGQVWLQLRAAGGWRQEMGMEGIDADAQGLEGTIQGSHWRESSSITRCYGEARAGHKPQLLGG